MLKLEDGTITGDASIIMKEIHRFYTELFRSDPEVEK